MKINYLIEINAFNQWLETNHLPPMAQLLWYKLIALFNKCCWEEWVTVDNQRLMGLLQINREATFIGYRDKLLEAGLIEYKKGKKGCPNRYRMIFFTFKSEVQSVVQSEVQSVVYPVVKSVVQSVDINKLNKTKLNNKKTYKKDSLVETRFTDFWNLYPKKIGKLAAEKAFKKLNPDADLQANILKAIETAKKSEQWNKNNGQFIPNPTTWINQGRWNDEMEIDNGGVINEEQAVCKYGINL